MQLFEIITPSIGLEIARSMTPIVFAVDVGNRMELLEIVTSCGDSI